jgi:hypothetical protein
VTWNAQISVPGAFYTRARRIAQRQHRSIAAIVSAAIERALRSVDAAPVRRICNFRCGRAGTHRCSRFARPGSLRCGHHWPERYPLDTRR